ncbi:mycofactocin system glycosyltransferase [Priestia megaterium]|uniref:glycosyltransferase family 2 protein n=1 Tax=Priestia megaterium TaxID=1404 RepID=UPI000E15E8A8|nr:glycosyltransferase [Priestia megaterium]SUV02264.1 mycofactocin system glycosyltransferase [Priestia megaterium]
MTKLKIGICICTFKRPEYLLRLLHSLLEIYCREELTLILVDNDEAQSAYPVAEKFKGRLNLIYELEQSKGLANARNKCIEKARELNLDYIVFLDDDEIVVNENWLKNLLNTAELYNSEIVTGPVMPLYDEKVKDYIKKSGFFDSASYVTGESLPHTGTGNTLIKLSILSYKNQVFSTKFNTSGGEDTSLFLELVKKGFKITWCDTAEVFEYIPLSRANMIYIFKRSFYSAVTYSKIELDKSASFKGKVRLNRILKGVVKTSKGIIVMSQSPFGKFDKFVKGLNLIGNGLGDIGGTIGVSKSNLYKN